MEGYEQNDGQDADNAERLTQFAFLHFIPLAVSMLKFVHYRRNIYHTYPVGI